MRSLYSSAHAAHKRARVAGEVAAQLACLGMVKCLAFSGSGRLLALGGDDGSLTVLDWPALRVRAELRCACSRPLSGLCCCSTLLVLGQTASSPPSARYATSRSFILLRHDLASWRLAACTCRVSCHATYHACGECQGKL